MRKARPKMRLLGASAQPAAFAAAAFLTTTALLAQTEPPQKPPAPAPTQPTPKKAAPPAPTGGPSGTGGASAKGTGGASAKGTDSKTKPAEGSTPAEVDQAAPSEPPPEPTEGEEDEAAQDGEQEATEAEGETGAEGQEEPAEGEEPSEGDDAPPAEGTKPATSFDATTGGMSTGSSTGAGFGAYPNPAEDEEALKQQGEKRPEDVKPTYLFAEDWWSHTRPTLELHGNFRVRSSIYHNFSLNRIDAPENALWPRPADDTYSDLQSGQHGARVCTPDEAKTGTSDDPADADAGCVSKTQGGANMRFRLEPSLVISDNLRVRSQIDLLGNLVLGSTPQGYSNYPTDNGYTVSNSDGYTPLSANTTSQTSPVSGVNSLQDAIQVQRVWAEYDTPVGQLKFGRMPDHWGLGILRNAGDDLDGDYQSTVDRIAFFTGIPSQFLYAGGSWDFMNEGPTSAAFTPPGGQAYDLSQRDDLSRMNLQLFRKMDDQLEELALSKGKVVVNGGLYLTYQWQRIANDLSGPSATCLDEASAIDCQPGDVDGGYARRGFKMWTPDIYVELKYKKFYAGIEAVTHQGKFDSLETQGGSPGDEDSWRINQWAVAGEIKQHLLEDRLLLGFYSGWASGDPDVDSLVPGDEVNDQIGDRTISTFRFHPGYRVDLILNRHLLSRVQGSYYFKPMAQYDFIRKTNGMRLGARAEAIWTRASNFLQTPGHHRDLGIELIGTAIYQSSDGVLNDRADLDGGFYSMLQYGVLFPLSGLGYQDQQRQNFDAADLKLKPAQMVRAFLGVAF